MTLSNRIKNLDPTDEVGLDMPIAIVTIIRLWYGFCDTGSVNDLTRQLQDIQTLKTVAGGKKVVHNCK